MNETIPFPIAVSPAKGEMLALLERVRTEIEAGECLAVVILPIHPNKEWSTRSAGDIGMLELGGILGRAWLTAMERLGS